MGSTTIAALIIIAVHLLVCMTLCLLHHVGVLKVDGLLLPFMALIPLWGPLSVALMHSRAVLRGGRRIPAGLQELKVEDQEQRNILVDDRTDYANTVPLEEALIVDNPRQRRNLMLSILNENPGQYANLLSQARLNEDVEVVHYAATAMAQISAKEDIALQQRMEEYERNRDSDEALDRYREALEHYLESSMEQGYARTLQMRRYADLLAERLKRHNDYRTVLIVVPELDSLGDELVSIMRWVEGGGNMMLAMTPEKTGYLDAIGPQIGIESSAYDYVMTKGIKPARDFMLSGGHTYMFSGQFKSSLSLNLNEKATVEAVSANGHTPLIWSADVRSGRTVTCNIGICRTSRRPAFLGYVKRFHAWQLCARQRPYHA